MTAKKVLRAQTELRWRTGFRRCIWWIRLGYFCVAGGCVFRIRDDFGRVFRNNAVMRIRWGYADYGDYGDVRGGRGLSAGDDGYGFDDGGLSGLFLAGPSLVQAALLGRRRARRSWVGRRCTRRFRGRWILEKDAFLSAEGLAWMMAAVAREEDRAGVGFAPPSRTRQRMGHPQLGSDHARCFRGWRLMR